MPIIILKSYYLVNILVIYQKQKKMSQYVNHNIQQQQFIPNIDLFDEQQQKIITGTYSSKSNDKIWMGQIVNRYISIKFQNQIFKGQPFLLQMKIKGQKTIKPFQNLQKSQHVTLGVFKGTRKDFLQLFYQLWKMLSQEIHIQWTNLLNIKSNRQGSDLLAFEVKAKCQGIQQELFLYLNKMIQQKSIEKSYLSFLPHISYGYVTKGFGDNAAKQILRKQEFKSVNFNGFYLYAGEKYKAKIKLELGKKFNAISKLELGKKYKDKSIWELGKKYKDKSWQEYNEMIDQNNQML